MKLSNKVRGVFIALIMAMGIMAVPSTASADTWQFGFGQDYYYRTNCSDVSNISAVLAVPGNVNAGDYEDDFVADYVDGCYAVATFYHSRHYQTFDYMANEVRTVYTFLYSIGAPDFFFVDPGSATLNWSPYNYCAPYGGCINWSN